MIEVDYKDLKFSEEKAVTMGCQELGAQVLNKVITSMIYTAFAMCQALCLASYVLDLIWSSQYSSIRHHF